MKLRTLVKRSLRFHWRSHLGVVIGAAIGSAALIGALIVGDSVKGSLRERALERLGNGALLLHTPERRFADFLPQRVRVMANNQALRTATQRHQGTTTDFPTTINPDLRERSMFVSVGSAAREDGASRLNRVQIIGLSDFAPALFSAHTMASRSAPRNIEITNVCVLNLKAATGLNVKQGDTIVLRVAKVSSLSSELTMASRDSQTATLRLRVETVVTNSELANFSPVSGTDVPANVFVPAVELAQSVGLHSSNGVQFANAWLGPEVVRLVPSRQRPRNAISSTVVNSWKWMERQLGIPSVRDGLPHLFVPLAEQTSTLNELLRKAWNFETVPVAHWKAVGNSVSLETERVFLDPPIVRSALAADTNAQPILTYLANLITVGTNATPYSMVTAAGAPWTPPNLRDDEIILNQWLADDLQAKPGDELTLVYYDPESGVRLTERTNTFRVHSIVPMEMPWADRTLMPQFPGIEKAETTAEWDTAFPLVHKIRPQDDDYWTEWRGTPKAFITLAAGQQMWANRFGNLTAIRFPIPTNMVGDEVTSLHSDPEPTPNPSKEGSLKSDAPTNAVPLLGGVGGEFSGPLETPQVVSYQERFRAALEKKILATLDPAELGLRFEPVREQALKAAEESQDFGGLFIGFSLFVIVAALLLMALLFQFSLEQRASEIGTLLALGFTPKQVRRLFLREGAALAFIGGILGTLGGIAYARAMLHGLTTLWRDAVGASTLKFFVTPTTLFIGLFASTLVAVFTLWLALRKQARQPARVLLTGALECSDSAPLPPVGDLSPTEPGAGARGSRATGRAARKRRLVAALQSGLPLATALGLIVWMLVKGDTANAGAFFGAGALVLIAGMAFVNAKLRRQASSLVVTTSATRQTASPTLATLAFRALARRRSRSVATVAMLACGTFLIVSIGVFRLDANRDATQRSSGTGSFALIGESTMPVVADLNTTPSLETFALNEADFADVNFVQFRVRAGDEASCLNLNRAQKPRLLGVEPQSLEGRFTFTKGEGWPSLRSSRREEAPSESAIQSHEAANRTNGTDEVPAIGDANSIQWAMGKKVGDTLDYVDERGQPFKVRIVGAVANSILQGQLIIDEAEFVKRFPGESGYKYFLIDAPTNRIAAVSAKLSRALQDVGLEVTPAARRLAQFNAVQNTYLGTFQVLGGLGLLLGSAGLGIVVLRNVLERRGELAVLLAVGWPRRMVRRLVLGEHAALLGLGLAIGLLAAMVAVLPSLMTPGAEFPWFTLSLTLAAVMANGVLWTWLATRVALRGELLAALRNE